MTQTAAMPGAAPWTSNPRLDLDALPGPEPMPLLGWRGNVLRYTLDPLAYMDSLAKGGYGKLVLFTRGMTHGLMRRSMSPAMVFAFGQDCIQQLLTQTAAFPETGLLRIAGETGVARFTSGLIWMKGDKHRQHRRLITPTLHHKRLDGFRDAMVAITGEALDRWRPGGSVDVLDEAGRILCAFQSKVVLGTDDVPGEISLGERLMNFFRSIELLSISSAFGLPRMSVRWLTERGDRLSYDLDAFIEKKRAAKEAGTDVLTMLMQARDQDGVGLTHDELVGQIVHLFVAAWVSPRSAVAWIVYLLAQHPKVAADLHDELSSALRGGAPTVAQLRELPLLEGVVKESLRLLPPVYVSPRISAEVAELGGYVLPAHTEINFSIFHTHRLPELYAEPRRFRPERWRSIDPGPFGYMPFGVGSRICPGLALSMMELKIVIAMLVQRFRLELPRRARIDYDAMTSLCPRVLRMQVHAQDRRFAESRAQMRGNVASLIDIDF